MRRHRSDGGGSACREPHEPARDRRPREPRSTITRVTRRHREDHTDDDEWRDHRDERGTELQSLWRCRDRDPLRKASSASANAAATSSRDKPPSRPAATVSANRRRSIGFDNLAARAGGRRCHGAPSLPDGHEPFVGELAVGPGGLHYTSSPCARPVWWPSPSRRHAVRRPLRPAPRWRSMAFTRSASNPAARRCPLPCGRVNTWPPSTARRCLCQAGRSGCTRPGGS